MGGMPARLPCSWKPGAHPARAPSTHSGPHGSSGRGSGGRVPVDTAGRLTFHVPGDGAEVHPGRGSQQPAELRRVRGPGAQASAALCGLCCNQRGDAERAGPGRQRAPRVHRRPGGLAGAASDCVHPAAPRPAQPTGPGGGGLRCHSQPPAPGPGDYGVTAPHSGLVAAEGPRWVERPRGVCGPFCFSSSLPRPLLPGTSVTSALRTSRRSHRGRGSLCPAKPPLRPTAPEWRQLHPERPASARVSEAPSDRRGAAWAQPCPCPRPLPPPPPWLPLHLGEERAVRARHRPQAGNPQRGRRPVLSAAEQDPAGKRPQPPSAGPLSWLGTRSRGTPPRPGRAAREPECHAHPRAPPASGQDAYTSGGWAVPAAPTSPRTGRAQGGPGAGPALAQGAGDTSEEFSPPGRIVRGPLPPTLHPGCPPGKAPLPWCPARPSTGRRGPP